jgi:hypothetical protein
MFMERVHYTNLCGQSVFCEYKNHWFAPHRACHRDFTLLRSVLFDTSTFRAMAQYQQSVELMPFKLEPVPHRVWSAMAKPKLVQSVGQVDEDRRYVTVLSTSNQKIPVSIEKPADYKEALPDGFDIASALEMFSAESDSKKKEDIPIASQLAAMTLQPNGRIGLSRNYNRLVII